MINAIIVEDEKYSVLNIQELLKKHAPDVTVTAIFESGKEALKHLPRIGFDLLFLDIQFNDDFDAFDLLEALPFEQINVVFVTSFNEYAIKAFKYNAIDYITKPIDKDELVNAIQKARKHIFRKKELVSLMETLQALKNRQIIIKGQSEVNFVNSDDIFFIRAEKDYSTIICSGEQNSEREILSSKHLGFWENELSEHPFLRVHKSYMVNMKHIISLGNRKVKLSNGRHVEIARDRRKEIELKVMEYKTRI